MTAPERRQAKESCYGHFQIARMRRAYTSVSGWHSELAGYEGFVAELRWGLNRLDSDARDRADRAVLTAVLGGTLPVAAIRRLAELAPGGMAWVFAEATPEAFGFLVGKVEREGDDQLRIPRCRFVSTAGRRVCLEVCRTPTERYFGNLGIPLKMTPDMHSFECHWRYGSQGSPKGAPEGAADGG